MLYQNKNTTKHTSFNKSNIIECIAACFAAFCLETYIVITVLEKEFSLIQVVSLHLLAVLILLLWFWASLIRKNDVRFALLLIISTTVAGIFGVLGTFVCLLLYVISKNKITPFKDWLANIYTDNQDNFTEKVYQNIAVGRDRISSTNIFVSFGDILDYGSFEEKQSVIANLARNFRPEFAPIIKSALSDKDFNVRTQAATIVAKLEKKFNKQTICLQNQVVSGEFKDYLTLATHIDGYAYLGLFDEIRESDMQKTALDYYYKCQSINPEHNKVRHAIGRILVKLELLQEAYKYFNAYGNNLKTNELSWFYECLYKLGKYNELRERLIEFNKSHNNKEEIPHKIHEYICLWLNQHTLAAS